MFKFISDASDNKFSWDFLGDVELGRVNLGEEMPVFVYRLFQYTMRDVLNKRLGSENCIDVFRDAGDMAGSEFAKNVLDLNLNLGEFIADLQKVLKDAKVGVLRIESMNPDASEIVMSIAEDLDCSGLPISGETVCNYDEGFIAGILKTYTGKLYVVREIDCWSKGDRVCRFSANIQN